MACVREGGHLVSVNSEEEMTFVHQLLFTISEAGRADQVYIVTDDEIKVLGDSGSSSFNHSMFTCGNGEIISQLAACDSYNDCSDNSDEKHCGTECSSSQYQCADGSCIHLTFYCDHINHCNDGSDEQHCQWRSCKDGEWKCGNKQCIPSANRCDVTCDCFDGSDEINCETCSLNSYQCYDKSCISKDRVCDAVADCPGGYKEDEYECTDSFKQTSCEQWWIIGTRLNGMYFIDQGTEGNLTCPGLYRCQQSTTCLLFDEVCDNIRQCPHGDDEVGCYITCPIGCSCEGNGLTTVEKNGFDGLVSLLFIDLRQNDVTKFSPDIFSRLSHLTQMKTDSYIFCCLKPESVSADNCFPKMDEFSSCRDLMRNDVLRGCLWIIAINALIGNVGVILYRIIYENTLVFKANWLFIMNLGVSDMLMGVYLGIIAFVDMYYSGNYILHDREWRDSTVCKFAGILAAISCEASVCFVMLTTFDCYLMVQFPFGRWRITYKTAKVSTLVCWLFVIIIAVVPIFETAYFSNMFYSRTAVCLALPFSRQKVSGWEYSTAIFVFFNCIAFIVIAWCQLSIYQIAKSSNRIMTKRTKQDLTLARRLFLIVLTDFLCWFPVGIMGILAMAGQVFPSEVYSWVAVFVMPLNAALNPFLYTFSTIKQMHLMKFARLLYLSTMHRFFRRGT
ncbi:G-protein coupled receptor GRL101-like [Mytilus californianus]|uniref:G-protein coupled receptor GRL101-like n=1 Tax=Mytilus californianus TaxID=6549 RepID=UPI002247AB1A|nr:G-protein coupled receptor GRL101-like [Mytilus californianus]